ncbi:MAG: sugar ABC transporter permease [Treponema sp. GWB1_62_6]|nr:MAG: sugar ABC transporter permease [Treponema sp. GWB1_62_6]
MNSQKKLGSRAFDVANLIALAALVFVTIYPLYYIGIVSISDGTAVNRGDVRLLPVDPTFEAYLTVFRNKDIWRAYSSAIIYTVAGTLINLFFSSLCAYPLSRKDFYGRSVFTFIIALTMFLSGGMIPLYIVVRKLRLIDTMWALVLPGAVNTFNMIIMRTFFQGIPASLHESARIDGANDIRVLRSIVLPLSMPIMATMTLFYAVQHWNSFFNALIYLNTKAKYPVQIMLRNIVVASEFADQQADIGSVSTNFNVVAQNYKYAVIMITVLPIICAYPFLQKHFAKGAMIGAIKG